MLLFRTETIVLLGQAYDKGMAIASCTPRRFIDAALTLQKDSDWFSHIQLVKMGLLAQVLDLWRHVWETQSPALENSISTMLNLEVENLPRLLAIEKKS